MADDDYQLRRPRHVLTTELEAAAADTSSDSRHRDRITVVLADAFTTPLLSEEFAALPQRSPTSAPWEDPWAQSSRPVPAPHDAFVKDLLARLDTISYEGAHAPYYSQRRAGAAARRLNLHGVAMGVRALMMTLDGRGYFEHAFGKGLPRRPRRPHPVRSHRTASGTPADLDHLAHRAGRGTYRPLRPHRGPARSRRVPACTPVPGLGRLRLAPFGVRSRHRASRLSVVG